MLDLKLNETPVRTTRNFQSNNITVKNVVLPEDIKEFTNIDIISNSEDVIIDNNAENKKLTYGLSGDLEKLVFEKANQKIRILVNGKIEEDIIVNFELDENNLDLIENIEVIASEESSANIFVKYTCKEEAKCPNVACENLSCDKNANIEELKYLHNGIIRVLAKENSYLKVTVVNLLDEKTNNFLSIENDVEASAKIDYYIVDFGGKNSITNYYTRISGENGENNLNTIYLGRNKQVFDLNYIGDLEGKKTKMNIEVQGALNDKSRKNFKGTLNFKRGAKKAVGDENEFCTLLSDTARSLAVPMLLCDEEDVEGNHSTAAGKLENEELFYIMTRGFSKKEAMKLMVRAKFNNIIENIPNENIKSEILEEIDKRLD